jgi:hypothetical protein
MNIQQFVCESLVQLTKGIQEAQGKLKDTSARINPGMLGSPEETSGKIIGKSDSDSTPVLLVEFDLAVTAAKGTETKGGIGILVGSIGIGSHGQTEKISESYSRLCFSVPMAFPRLEG